MTDKRRSAQTPPSEGGAEQAPPSGGGDLPGTHTEHAGSGSPSGDGDLHGTHTEHAGRPAGASESGDDQSLNTASLLQTPPPAGSGGGQPSDYLGDLQRLQAEFDNYRKRVRAEGAVASDRGAARVIEDLLPVLDNFERAISHGEGGEGVQLVFKELKDTLEREGLEEVAGEGAAFDPNVHEAVESRVVEGLEESAIVEVYRRGYLHKGQLLRPAMVVVGRPAETNEVTE